MWTSSRISCVLKRQLNVYINQKRTKYVILLPEIDPEIADQIMATTNELPEFSKLTAPKIGNIMGKQLIDYECILRNYNIKLQDHPDVYQDLFQDVLDPIEKETASFDNVWAMLKVLYLANSQLVPPSMYFNLGNRVNAARTVKFDCEYIYKACKTCDKSKLTEEQARLVDKYVFEGHMNGFDASPRMRSRIRFRYLKLFDRMYEFKIRVEAARTQFFLIVEDGTLMRDFPIKALKLMSNKNPEDPTKGPWTVKLTWGLGDTFLEYCPDRELRWLVWQAEDKAASQNEEVRELFNSICVEEIRFWRYECAKCCGYENYTEAVMPTKMAGSLEHVQNTLGMFLAAAKTAQWNEIVNLQAFADERGCRTPIQLWDVPYWSRKQKMVLFNFNDEGMREYLPMDRVMNGLYKLCFYLFGITFELAENVDVWHPEVNFFHVFEPNNDKPVAGFYFDPYYRPEKTQTVGDNCHIVCIRNSSRIPKVVMPLTAFIGNFSRPTREVPSLLSFSEVKTIFSMFGRNLQYLLCKSTYYDLSGLNFVEHDATEVGSKFMEQWLYNPTIFDWIQGHYKTGEKLKGTDLNGARKHLAGYRLSKELYKANMDLIMHTNPRRYWRDIATDIWDDHFIFPMSRTHSDPLRYEDIFSVNMGAAYYRHIWSEMLVADILNAFRENEDHASVGARFRDTFLTFGGSCAASEVFRRFRGRDPYPKALLDSLDLGETTEKLDEPSPTKSSVQSDLALAN